MNSLYRERLEHAENCILILQAQLARAEASLAAAEARIAALEARQQTAAPGTPSFPPPMRPMAVESCRPAPLDVTPVLTCWLVREAGR